MVILVINYYAWTNWLSDRHSSESRKLPWKLDLFLKRCHCHLVVYMECPIHAALFQYQEKLEEIF